MMFSKRNVPKGMLERLSMKLHINSKQNKAETVINVKSNFLFFIVNLSHIDKYVIEKAFPDAKNLPKTCQDVWHVIHRIDTVLSHNHSGNITNLYYHFNLISHIISIVKRI